MQKMRSDGFDLLEPGDTFTFNGEELVIERVICGDIRVGGGTDVIISRRSPDDGNERRVPWEAYVYE